MEYNSGWTIWVTSSSTLSVDTWHRVSWAFYRTSSSVNELRVWLDGTLACTVSNHTWSNLDTNVLLINPNVTTAWFDDIYIDDAASSLTDPGDIRVTYKGPDEANATGFDTDVGTGAVNERALSVTNGKQHAGTSDVQQNYTLQTASEGDVNISGARILGYTGWVYAKRGDPTLSGNNALTRIGNTQSKTTGTTTVITTTAAVSAGDAILVAWAGDDNGNPGTTATCADTATGGSNSYPSNQSVQASATGTATGVRAAVFAALNVNALPSGQTITITHGNIAARAAVAYKVPGGLVTSSALDKSSSNVQAATTAPTSNATATLAQSEEVFFGCWGSEDNLTDVVGTSRLSGVGYGNSEFGDGTDSGGSGSNITAVAQWAIVDDTTGRAAGATGAASADATTVIGAYKAATGSISRGDPKLMLNGTEYSKTLTTSNALYTEVITDTNYPSNAAGIGMRSSGTSADTYLYECGVLVAYIPNFPPAYRRPRQIDMRV